MDFDAFYKDLEKELLALVKKQFKKYRTAAQKDVMEYLRLSKGRLEDYARLLTRKEITTEEQAFLTEALKQNALLYALKESGRTTMAVKRFTEGVVTTTLELLLVYVVKDVF